MSVRTKKVKSVGRFGARYGVRIRRRIREVEVRQKGWHECPACAAPFPSAFAIECEECGAEIRPPEVLGVRIRKPGK